MIWLTILVIAVIVACVAGAFVRAEADRNAALAAAPHHERHDRPV